MEIAIISAGWDIIGCKPATYNTEGVAPLDSIRLLQQVKDEKKIGRKVVVYLHWDYELEIYPQPTHRYLAKHLIDYVQHIQVKQNEVGKAIFYITSSENYSHEYLIDKMDLSNVDLDFSFEVIQSPIKTAAAKVPLLIRS